MDIATFASERKDILERYDTLLESVVADALARLQRREEGWMSDLLDLLADIFTDVFVAEYDEPAPALRELREAFLDRVTDALGYTTPPEGGVSEGQVKRVTYWLSGYAVNAATEAAGIAEASATGDEIVKMWITMLDTEVRHLHRPLHGQSVPVGATFEVGGVELSYPGQPVGPPAVWIQCRCVLAVGTKEEVGAMSAQAEALEASVTITVNEDEVTPVTEDDLEELEGDPSSGEPIPWHGILAPEGVPTGDRRKFAIGAMRHRELPIPLLWQPSNEPGHDGAVIVGRIDRIWRDEENMLRADGVFSSSQEAEQAVLLLVEGALSGVSVDVDEATLQIQDAEGNLVEDELAEGALRVLVDGRISAATLVAIPAFAEAFVALGPWEIEADSMDEAQEQAAEGMGQESVLSEEFRRGPGWVTHPKATARLHNYWVRGEGAAKIAWGTPGSFRRCRAQLSKYIPTHLLNRVCAEWYHDATGIWPGRKRGDKGLAADGSPAPAFTLVAAAAPEEAPPLAAFLDPNLPGPTPLTVTPEGRVFGHVATWGTCHIGISGVCTTPPSSITDYAYFHTGSLATQEGDVAVGALTIGTGHAGSNLRSHAAAEHYDNTGTAWAYVRAGEDKYGIWVNGVVAPGVDELTLKRAKASALSGDWRRIGSNLEMVAALSVNVPGFPIPAVSVAASAGEQTMLVASGIVTKPPQDAPLDYADIAKAVIKETRAIEARALTASGLKRKMRAEAAAKLKGRI